MPDPLAAAPPSTTTSRRLQAQPKRKKRKSNNNTAVIYAAVAGGVVLVGIVILVIARMVGSSGNTVVATADAGSQDVVGPSVADDAGECFARLHSARVGGDQEGWKAAIRDARERKDMLNVLQEHGIADREPNVEFRRTSAYALVEIVPSYQDQAALFNTLLDREADPEVKAVILNYAKNGAAGRKVDGQRHPSQDAASSSPAARASLPERSGWSWRRYESDSGGYSADFPAKPVFDKTNLIMDDRTKKITAFVTAQPQSSSTKENLERAIDEHKRMFRQMLISSERTSVLGYPGARILVHGIQRGEKMRHRMLLVSTSSKLIIAGWVCSRDAPATSEPDYFFNSLRIAN